MEDDRGELVKFREVDFGRRFLGWFLRRARWRQLLHWKLKRGSETTALLAMIP